MLKKQLYSKDNKKQNKLQKRIERFENNKFIEYKLSKCTKNKTIRYTLETNEYDTIVFKNIF